MKRSKAGFVVLALAGVAALAVSGRSAMASPATQAGTGHVVVIGISGLRWSDVSRSATPAIWRLAETGAVGSLVTTTVRTSTCPADAWLTLNAGARAAEPARGSSPCPPVPVLPGRAGQATVPAMRSIVTYNASTGYEPHWGTLAGAAGHGRCAAAIGPGAALALADGAGNVARYQRALRATRDQLLRTAVDACRLTLADLGALPVTPRRAAELAADDHRVAAIVAAASRDATVVVAGLGDDGSPHLRAIVVSGPGYRSGSLTSASTRQPGIVTVTDLTPAIFTWLGQPVPSGLSGSPITSAGRGTLPGTIRSMIGQDVANEVYRSIVGWFFLILGVGEAVLFALIAFFFRGAAEPVVRRRVACCTAAGTFGAALPVGTFLAGVVPWGRFAHPALWLYGLGVVWAALIAVSAVAGPWRRQAFGPPGFVCAVTIAVIGIDVITGSRLQLGAPFGLSLVEAGRFYGVGNNALGVYAVAGMLAAAWAGVAVLRGDAGRWLVRRTLDPRHAAVAAAGLVALATVIASGWPGFGAKVGGTIAMVPAYLVLLAAIAGIRLTPRRWLVVAISGVALVAIFAILDYLIPAIGPSHLGGFVGQLVHGGAGGTLKRKISSNLHSLTTTWYTPVVPVVAIVTGLMLAWPARLRLATFVAASESEPLLRPALVAVWVAVVLGWLADDSGVSLAAAALPIALPLAIVLSVRIANSPVAGAAIGDRANLCAAEQ